MISKPRRVVLVFPCRTEIGLELYRALKYSTQIKLVGTSSVSSNHGKYVYKSYIKGIHFVDDPGFIDESSALIDEHQVDFVFPAHDSVVLKLAQIQDELHCEFVGRSI